MYALSSLQRRQTSIDAVPEQAKTFSKQHLLPRLPVPPLRATLNGYLRSLIPLIRDEVTREGGKDQEKSFWLQYGKRRRWADDFEAGIGRIWQERLVDIDRASPHNWLDDNFWTSSAYLTWRVPLPVNSNWWCLFVDDPAIPSDVATSGSTPWQTRRAASLVHRFLDFRYRLQREDIPPDGSRAGPYDMHQYTRVFGMTRVPAIPADRLVCRPDSKHIVVFARDQPFSVEVCDDDGAPLDVAVIEQRLFTVTSQLDRTAVPVGTLTGLDRDSWAAAREHLLQISPVNRTTLAAIEDAVMVVALDESTLQTEASTSALASTGCDGPDELGLDERIVSAATGAAGHNRWFDKSMTLIVGSNGRAAVSGEHSPCDALIPAIVMDYAVGSSKLSELTHAMPSEPATDGWTRLEWQTDDRIKEAVGHAEATVSAIGKDSDAHQLWFDIFGVDWIRQTDRLPPDAFIQLALQLAYRTLHGRGCPTYETASTRSFARGRTETIRTYSESTRAFCEAAVSIDEAGHNLPVRNRDADLFVLLKKAIDDHHAATRECSTGHGFDRHLLGLRLVQSATERMPMLFRDHLFARSTNFRLSTSGLSAGDRFLGTGFGTPGHDGYGINCTCQHLVFLTYADLASGSLIKFGIESKRSSSHTDTLAFRKAITSAMLRLREIVEKRRAAIDAKL